MGKYQQQKSDAAHAATGKLLFTMQINQLCKHCCTTIKNKSPCSKLKTTLLLFSLLLFFCCMASGQTSQLNFHQLTVEEGLSETTNNFLYMDSGGFTWIGSLDGLNLFDGKEVTIFKNSTKSFKGVDIQGTFFEDNANNLWFTTGEAINCYDRSQAHFKHFYAAGKQDVYSGVHASFYLDKAQFLWVIADCKVYKFCTVSHTATAITSPDDLCRRHATIDTSLDGSLRTLYTYDQGFRGFETRGFGENNEVTAPQQWFHQVDSGYLVFQIIPNVSGGSAACILTDKGLLFFDPQHYFQHCIYKFPDGFKGITHLAKYDNKLWLVNRSDEIAFFDLEQRLFAKRKFRAFNVDENERINNISRIFFGKDSTLWVGVKEKGIFFANLRNQRAFSVFTHNNIAPCSINNFYEAANGDIWCVSDNKKGWVFNQGQVLKDELTLPKYFRSVAACSNETAAISNQGLLEFSNDEITANWIPPPPGVLIFYDITRYDDKRFLIGTNNGIWLFNKEDKSYQKVGTYAGFVVRVLMDNKQRLWIANATDELLVWKLQDCHREVLTENQRLFSNLGMINHLTLDTKRECMWLATSKGLVSFSTIDFRKSVWTETNGLPNQYIQAVLIDHNHHLWLSTNRGITKFAPGQNNNIPFMHLSIRDGLSSEVYNSGAALLSKSGQLWFGGTNGVDLIDPEIHSIGKAPKLAIKSLKVNGKDWNTGQSINTLNQLNLPYDQNTLAFKLSALEYTDPKRNQFKVFLKREMHVDSTFLNTDNSIMYPHLSSGKYQLRFTACNSEGIWQQDQHVLGIEITPPYYQTWWFKTIVFFLTLSLVGLALSFYYRHQLKIKELEKEKMIVLEQERERIKDEIHDRMGKDLTAIKFMSEAMSGQQNTVKVLQGISKRAKSMSETMRHLVWTLNRENDSLTNLIGKLRLDTITFLGEVNLIAEFNMPDDIPELQVGGHARHHISLVVNEVLTNIARHARATNVECNIVITGHLFITIKDNGNGFDPEGINNYFSATTGNAVPQFANNGNGLCSCVKRIKQMQGHIEWSRLQSGGMEVIIELALEKLT